MFDKRSQMSIFSGLFTIYINFVKMFVCQFDWGQYKSVYYLIISNFKLEENFNLSKQDAILMPLPVNGF